jgi:hypothetical protein
MERIRGRCKAPGGGGLQGGLNSGGKVALTVRNGDSARPYGALLKARACSFVKQHEPDAFRLPVKGNCCKFWRGDSRHDRA